MIGVKIADIPGALVEFTVSVHANDTQKLWTELKNDAITQQGQVAIGLNREKTAKTIYDKRYYGTPWDNQIVPIKQLSYELADAIIANEQEILEIK